MAEYEIIGTQASQNSGDSLMVSVSQDEQYSSLPPGPAGPQAVPVASLPPGPTGPQAVPVAALPPGPSAPQAVPVAVQQYSSVQTNQQIAAPLQQQAQFQQNQTIQTSQQHYQPMNAQNSRNGSMQQQYLFNQDEGQSQTSHQSQQLQYQIVVQQPGPEQTQVYQSQTQQNLQQGTSHNQQYQGQQQYIQVQQSQPSVIHIPRQMPPRQQATQNHYQYQVQDHSNQQNHPASQSGQPPQHSHLQQQQPQQQFVVMQVQHPQQQQQVVSYQYQQPQNVQHQQGIQQSQPRYIIQQQQQQSGVQANTPTAPQRFFIKSPHQGPQRHLTPTMQTVNRSPQYSAPTSNQAQQLNPVRQQWQTQQQPIRGQVMNQQIPLQQGIPQKRTIMIQSNSPVQGNVIRLQPNSNFQSGQQRMMQIHPSNNGAVMQPCSQPINNTGQQQYSNLRMTNGVQGPSQVIRPNIPPRVPHHVNLRPMTANSSQGQYPTQTTGNMPQQSTVIQQQGMSNLRQQSPINQWENRPRISLQTSHHPQNPRSSVPQQQPFTMQMRPSGQTIVQAPQVQESNQQNDIAYDVEHVFNENGREVRKMPIKMGEDTIWVDVKNEGASGNSEDSIMFKLDMEGNGNPNANVPETRAVEDSATNSPSDDALHQTHPVIHTDWKSNKNKLTDELRNQIVKECCEDLISPAELASRHGVNVVQIRKIVKDAGKKLPTKYKVTSSRNISTTVQCSTTLGPTNHVTQTPAVSGHQNQMSIHGPQLVSSSNAGVFRQVIVTDSSGNKVHGIAGTNQSLGLTLPQKPTPPGITLVKPGFNPPSAAGKTSSGANTVLDKKTSISTEEQSYKGKIIPGKLAVCRNCGGYSSDFNRCSRCKKPIPENCKTVDDDTKFGKTVKGEFSKLNAERLREANKDVLRNIRIQHKGRKKQNQDEPECIALSSDEDGDDEDEETESRTGDEEFDTDEGNKNDIKDTEKDLQIEKVASELSEIISVSDNQGKTYASLQCRSVRIGSYKSMPKEKAFVTEEAFQIKVPSIGNQNELVTLTILKCEISHIYAHFGRTMPLLFIFCHGHACARIRSSLKMTSKNTGLWFDVDCNDETMKRLTILPDKMTDDTKNIMMKYYGETIKELDSKTANEILVRSSPKDMKHRQLVGHISKDIGPTSSIIRLSKAEPPPIQKYCQYPPTGSSSVSVTTEDYYCLEEESFLNDTTIDFYFKWLQFSLLTPKDRDRTHIFSTFFYKRLTTRPAKQKNKVHPVEDDPNLTPADKRYERVKRWTKKTNIFEKDFIVVPINEHSHWFVAVICFPGIEGCRNSDTNQSVDEPESQKKASEAQQLRKKKRPKDGTKRVMQIGSTSIIPLKGAGASGLLEKFGLDDDQSDRDEAEASDDDIFNPEDDEFLFDAQLSKDDSSQGKADNDAQDCDVTKPKEEPTEREEAVKDENKCDEKDSSKNEKSSENVDESITSGTSLSDSVEKEPSKDTPAKEENNADNSSSDLRNIIKEETPIRQPCILIFDSLHSGSRAKVAATLREYLACEYKAKMAHLGRQRIFNKETFRGCCPKVPQQPNFSDCGLYLLQYIEAFFETPIRSFALPITSLNNWFPKETVKHKREKIAEIIRNLAVTQNPDKKFNFPALEFVGVGAGYSDDEDDDDDMEPDEKESNLVHPSVGSSSIVITTSARPEAQLPTPASNTSLVMNDENDRIKVNKVILSNNSAAVNTTTINLGGVKSINEKNKCMIKSISTSQPPTFKVTHALGSIQPKVITLSSSTKNNTTIIPSPVQKTAPPNTIVKPIVSSSLKASAPRQLVPTKVVNIPIKGNIQPVKMTVSATIASSGPTGHTMILKKAGKIETFPVPSSTPNNVSNSLVSKDFEKGDVKQEVEPNSPQKVENNIADPSKMIISKKTNCENDEARTVTNLLRPIMSKEHINVAKDTAMKPDQVVSTVTFKHSCHIPQSSGSKAVSLFQQVTPDSTSCNVEPILGNSNQVDRPDPSANHQTKNSFSSLNQISSPQGKINSDSTNTDKSEIIRANENPQNVISSNRPIDQDSSINSSNESVIKNFENDPNNSRVSIASLKRSSSEARSPTDQYVSKIDQSNEKPLKENSSIIQEQEYPAAKKSKL